MQSNSFKSLKDNTHAISWYYKICEFKKKEIAKAAEDIYHHTLR